MKSESALPGWSAIVAWQVVSVSRTVADGSVSAHSANHHLDCMIRIDVVSPLAEKQADQRPDFSVTG